MFLRSWLVILSSTLISLAGCVSGEQDVPAGEIVAAPGSPVLEADPAAPPQGVLPNDSVELRVRYRGASGEGISGIQVDFALTEVAPGASLTPWRATTDADGVATTRLIVGSMPGQLVVRAVAREASSLYMQVHVGEVVKSRLSVRVDYAGTRKVSTYVVSAVPGRACTEALASGAVGDVVHRFGGGDEQVAFELDPRTRSAIVAWARDDAGSQLARGCVDFRSTGSADEALMLALEDTPLRIDQPVPLALALELDDSAARLDTLAHAVLAEQLRPYSTDAPASLYLASIAQQLGVPVDTLGAHRASLAARLARAEVGPEPLARALGEQLARRAARVSLQTRYASGQTPTVESLQALASDDGSVLTLALRPALALQARLEAGQAQLQVASLRVELSLGALAKAILGALDDASDGELASELASAAGCREVVGPWAASEGLCDASIAQAACEQVTRDLRTRYERALDALSSAPLELSGDLQVRDRDEDGVVDELGPSALSGHWLEGDAVQATGRAPTQTALML